MRRKFWQLDQLDLLARDPRYKKLASRVIVNICTIAAAYNPYQERLPGSVKVIA